jgi:hypothetical protein
MVLWMIIGLALECHSYTMLLYVVLVVSNNLLWYYGKDCVNQPVEWLLHGFTNIQGVLLYVPFMSYLRHWVTSVGTSV